MDSRVRFAVRLGIGILFIAVILLAARAIGNIVASKLNAATPYGIGSIGAADQRITQADSNANLILYNRNLFNQRASFDTDEPITELPVQEITLDPVPELEWDGTRPVLTDMRVILRGTQVASNPAYSVAMFTPLDGTDVRTLFLMENSDLLGEARILRIVRNRVFLERYSQGNRLEYIDIRTTEEDLADAKKALERRPAEKPAQPAPQQEVVAADANTIRRVGQDTFEIPRDMVEKIRNNPNILNNSPEFGPLPQLQPIYRGNAISSFRVLNVQSDSIYAQLGIRSGDTILDINGQQVDNPQKAMSFFDALQPGQDVGMRINRSGQERTLTFQLR